jgi:hypothetical protein
VDHILLSQELAVGSGQIHSLVSLTAAAGWLAVGCGPGGSAPELEAVESQVVAVNQELVLLLAATDPDGDELSYSFDADVPDIDRRAIISPLAVGGQGEFRWTPLAADVGVWTFDFTVSDGDHDSTQSAHIDVRSAVGDNSAPSFLHPQGNGTTLDLDDQSCLEIDVEVLDSDSAEVSIAQDEPLIEGASLEQTAGLTAIWRWCPSEVQVAADDRYTVMLSADDGDNPRTVHPYLVVLRRATKPNCPGEAPAITHSASDQSTLVGLSLTADVSDDRGLKREPLLYYSTSQPSDPPDLGAMTQVSMALVSGDMRSGRWRAQVPNPVAGLPQGARRDLYYLIVADDDDDPAGSCDHVTEMPASGAYRMSVTNPGGQGGAGLCEPCTHDVQCGGTSDHCVRIGTESEAYCTRACSSSSGCPSGYSCSASPVESVGGQSSRQCVPDSADCSNPGGGLCDDDSREDNDSLAQALEKPLLASGDHDLVSCPAPAGTGDDEDWFEIATENDTRVTVTLAGGAQSDLDLALYRADGSLIASSLSYSSDEEVSACIESGYYLVRVFAWSPAENPYQLGFTRSSTTCGEVCEADDNEQDDGPAAARATNLQADDYLSTTQSICPADDDWIEADVRTGDLLVVDLTFEQTASSEDLDVHLYAPNGTTDLTPCTPEDPGACDLDNGQSADSDEHFEFTTPAGCTPCRYYVVVRGYDGSQNLYDLSMHVE